MIKTSRFTTLTLIFSGLLSITQAGELPRWVIASTKSSGSPIAIQQEADHVVLELTLGSTQSNPDKRPEELREATEEIEEKAKDDRTILLVEARLDHSAGTVAGLTNLEFGNKGRRSKTTDKEDEAAASTPSTSTVYVMTSTKLRGDPFLEQAEALLDFADKLVLGAVTVDIGTIQLCVANPEQYRAALLKDIMSEMSTLRELGGPATILHVSGLEGPVEVRQIDPLNVELFINYRLTLEQWGSKAPTSFPDR